MTWRIAFFTLLIVFIVFNCSQKGMQVAPDRAKTLDLRDVSSFHPAVTVKLGWVPYQQQKLVKTGKNEWRVVLETEKKEGTKVPVLFVESGNSEEPILLDMNIDNKLLGKLIKHSAITQQPIQRPFTNFFEEAKCQSCHPKEVKVDFD